MREAVVRDPIGRLYAPATALFACALLAARAPGEGVGFAAGLVFALVLALYTLLLGAEAACRAAPPFLMRMLASAGLAMAAIASALPAFAHTARLVEAGLLLMTSAGAGLVLNAVAGRAPTLRDEPW